MDNNKEELLKTVVLVATEILKKWNFVYIETGKIISVIDSINYTVSINDSETTVKATNGITYEVNDIVEILVKNNMKSDKKILWKRL